MKTNQNSTRGTRRATPDPDRLMQFVTECDSHLEMCIFCCGECAHVLSWQRTQHNATALQNRAVGANGYLDMICRKPLHARRALPGKGRERVRQLGKHGQSRAERESLRYFLCYVLSGAN